MASIPFLALVFLSSFLLFAIELIFARLLLPTFGSAAAVWTTCLMFYQGLLFLGYAYAGRIAPFMLKSRGLLWGHLLIIALPALLFPLTIDGGEGHPIWMIFMALLTSVGLPFLALSTTSVVAQTLLTGTDLPGRDDPYFLYGTSNAGSLLALLAYPLLIEPHLGMAAQLKFWYGGYALFVILMGLCIAKVKGEAAPVETQDASTDDGPTPRMILVWLLLAGGANALLMAITNVVTLDAPMPLLWTVPLTLYLCTLILCFKRVPTSRATVNRLAFVAVGISLLALFLLMAGMNQQLALIVLGNLVLFVGALRTHFLLSSSRPKNTAHLGTFFLAMSLGGWLGSFLIAVFVPWAFSSIATNGVDCAVAGVLLLSAMVLKDLDAFIEGAKGRPLVAVLLLATVGVFGWGAQWIVAQGTQGFVASARTFYGLYHIKDEDGLRKFIHGNTVHGLQNLDPARQDEPLSYYYWESPVGSVLWSLKGERDRVAVVGLGAGVLASYGEAGERWDFYELDGKVLELAQAHYGYLDGSAADLHHHIGDARLTLQKVEPQAFDLMILDTFSSDFVPLHLVTQEAIQLYREKLKGDGVLLFHITNRVFDLRPIFARLAESLGAQWAVFTKGDLTPADLAQGKLATTWFIMSWDGARLAQATSVGAWHGDLGVDLPAEPWRDDWVNIFEGLR